MFGAAMIFVVLFWRLGAPAFWDPDEAHYAETTREMIERADWWAPYYNGIPFFDKPMLFHQLQGAAMLLWGPTEFAARIVPALGGLGLVLVTGWFAAQVAGRETAVVAALLVASNAGLFGLARYAILDSLFTLLTFGGAAALTVSALGARPRLQWIGYLAIALGVLVKGPLALVLCGLTLLLAIVISPDARRRLLGLHWIAGLIVIIVVSAPPFLYLYFRFGRAFVDGYVLDENIRLYTGSRFGGQPSPFFYFQILATGLLPWTPLVAGRLVDDVRAAVRGDGPDTVDRLLWAWTAAIVGFFSLSTFKLDHYVFPAVPAAAVIGARAWRDLRAEPDSPRHRASRVGVLTIGPLLTAIGIVFAYLLVARLDLPRAALIAPAAVITAGVWMTVSLARSRGRTGRAPWHALAAMLVTYAGLLLFVMPALEEGKAAPALARFVAERAAPADRIATYRLHQWPAFRFYVHRQTSFLDDAAETRAFFAAPDGFYCVMQRHSYDEFRAAGVPLQIVYERDGQTTTSGRVLWRGHPEPTHFVVVTRAR